MKGFRNIFGIFKNNLKLSIKNIETFFQRQNMKKTFSLSYDMVKDVDNGKKWKQDSLMEILTVIRESELVQLLINAYKIMTQL